MSKDYLSVYKFRTMKTYIDVNNILFIGNILRFYNRCRQFDEDFKVKYEQLFNIKLSDEEYKRFINSIRNYLDNEDITRLSFKSGYLLGYSLWCYIKKYINIDDEFIEKMKLLNGIIKNMDLRLTDTLKVIDIDINSDDFFDKVYCALNEEFDLIKNLSQKQNN